MSEYLLIESRDPNECARAAEDRRLARDLRAAGHRVLVYLVQNGVLPARVGAEPCGLSELARAGVEVAADDFSLRERGIAADRLVEGVRPAPLGTVLDALSRGSKALWL